MKTNLTDKAIRAAKVKPGERLELWDKGCRGLCLRVTGTGKAFFFRYRTADGRQPRIKLGDFTDVFGLADARLKANRLRIDVTDGKDPAGERRAVQAAARSQAIKTFDQLADAFLRASEAGDWRPKGKHKRARTIADERGSLDRHIRPALGKLRPSAVTRAEVRAFLAGMKAKGIGAQTQKAHAVTRQVFAYAIAEELAGVLVNPAVGFPAPVTMTPRARVLSDREIKRLWAGLEDTAGLRQPPSEDGTPGAKVTIGRPVRIAIQLAALLLQRRGEVAGMEVAELDLEAGLWRIPGERMKGGRPHLVPLPPRAVVLIGEAMKLAAFDRKEPPAHVFPSPHDVTKPIRPDSLSHAMAEITGALKIPGATIHDLRRTGSTALTSERLSVAPFVRSQVLGHVTDTGGGSAVSSTHYDANSYIAEKRKALEAWEGLLLEIVGERVRPAADEQSTAANDDG